jgi:hypothetical protein
MSHQEDLSSKDQNPERKSHRTRNAVLATVGAVAVGTGTYVLSGPHDGPETGGSLQEQLNNGAEAAAVELSDTLLEMQAAQEKAGNDFAVINEPGAGSDRLDGVNLVTPGPVPDQMSQYRMYTQLEDPEAGADADNIMSVTFMVSNLEASTGAQISQVPAYSMTISQSNEPGAWALSGTVGRPDGGQDDFAGDFSHKPLPIEGVAAVDSIEDLHAVVEQAKDIIAMAQDGRPAEGFELPIHP